MSALREVKPPQYWLMKSEPSVYSIDDLAREGIGQWDGIRNYQVRNLLRDTFRVGDVAVFYHSSTAVPGAVGLMKVVGEAYPDPTQFDPKSEYYDEKSREDSPRWLAIHVAFKAKFPTIVTLEAMRQDKQLQDLLILKRGNRLSITKLTSGEFHRIVALGRGKGDVLSSRVG